MTEKTKRKKRKVRVNALTFPNRDKMLKSPPLGKAVEGGKQ